MTTYEKIKKRQEERAQALAELRKLNEEAEAAGTAVDESDDSPWSKGMARAQDLTKEIQRLEQLDEMERAAASNGETRSDPDPATDETEVAPEKVQARMPDGMVAVERRKGEDALAKLLGVPRLAAGLKNDPRMSKEYREMFAVSLAADPNSVAYRRAVDKLVESRDIQTDSDQQAGYLVPPLQFVAELLQDLDDEVFMRAWSRQFTVRQAKSLGAPRRAAKMSTFAWSAEIQAPTKDTAFKVGMRNLFPHYLSGEVTVSRDWLRNAVMDPEEIVRRELARDAGEVIEDGFLKGNGSQQPLGIFTASADGISTGRDVATGNTTTGMKFDGLINAKYSIKAGYWPRLRFLTSRTGQKQLALEKDGEGRYLWRESVRVGEPDRVLGVPGFMSERVPATFTTGLYVGIFGDFFNGYWIADALDMTVQRLVELNARTNQDGFLARLKTDGMPVLEEAFARVKLA